MSEDFRIFLEHIRSSEFELGVDKGKWGVAGDLQFPNLPHVVLWVKASGINCPEKFFLRFELTNYPTAAPTAGLWDVESNQTLPFTSFPKGHDSVISVFKNQNHLYAPCDRLNGHPDWYNHPVYKEWCWYPGDTIVKYLRFIYDTLQCAR